MKKAIISFALAALTALMPCSALADGDFYAGGDMTEVNYIEDLGGVYKDENGTKVDPFEFLADKGMNMARIRLSNNPGKGRGDGTYYLPDGYQNEEDCLKLSKRAADAGMDIQFTFNYSDYWSNGTRQIVPADWAAQIKDELGYDIRSASFLKSMTAAQKKQIQDKLVTIIYDYTFDIMTKLKEQNTLPKYVSLGNEINGGLLFPFGNAYEANMNEDRFELVFDSKKDDANDIKCSKEIEYFRKFLKSGYDAVKQVSPDTQVIIHLATEGSNHAINDGKYTWLMDEAVKAGAVDVLGASYYPAWSESPIEAAAAFCERMYAKYNKPVMIMETGYNWTPKKKNGHDGQLVATAPGYDTKYPYTPEGHYNYLSDVFTQLRDTGCCVGVLYWDPAMIHVNDPANPNESLSGWAYKEDTDKPDGNVVENTTLFDFDGKAVKAVNAYGLTIKKLDVKEFKVENKKASATVTNSTDKTETIFLLTAEYDDGGVLTGVKLNKKAVEPGGEVSAETEITTDKYAAFLWNGETLQPLSAKIASSEA